MNNWHLLLLALAAVFKPIATFTERNLVDGRQQCCDRQSDIGLRDGRESFLYGTDSLSKTTTLLRHLNDGDETRSDRRTELRQRDTVVTRRSKERSLLDNRERDSVRIPTNLVRLTRAENHPERLSIYDNGDRRVDIERRNRYSRNIDDVNSEGRSVTRIRDSVMRFNGRTNELRSRSNNFRASRFSNVRFARDFDSTGYFRSTENNLQQTREDSLKISNGNRQEVVGQQKKALKRETLSRGEVRRYINNNDEQRAISERSRVDDRINMRSRDNSRDEIRNNRDSVDAIRRFMRESSAERRQQKMESRVHNRESPDLRENNDERRERERYVEQRSSLLESSRVGERIHNIRSRDISRAASRENRDRDNINQRFKRETSKKRRRFLVESRRHIRQRIDHRLSPEYNNDERREREQYSYERRILLDNSRGGQRVHDMLFRDNAGNKNRETRDLRGTDRRVRSEERRQQLDESREHVRQTVERRLSRENNNDKRREREHHTTQRRATSESPRVDIKIHNTRLQDSRDEIRENRDRVRTNQRFVREMSGERRQPETDRNRRLSRENNNDERRERELYVEQRRALSESSKADERIQRSRENSRDEIRANRGRINANERLGQNIERSVSRRNSKDDRRAQERYTEQRRALSESTRVDERIRNMHSRVNSREDNSRENRDRVTTNQQIIRERAVDRSREHARQNTDLRLSRDRIEMAVGVTRVPKNMDSINIRLNRAIVSRQGIRYNGRQNTDKRDNKIISERHFASRESGKIPSMEQSRARSWDVRNFRDVNIAPKLSQAAEMVRASDVLHKQVEYRNNKDMIQRDATETRFLQIDRRNPNMVDAKIEDVAEAVTSNWHYIFYTIQTAYLCGLFMQMMLPNRSEKSKIMNLRWWSEKPIKVD